MTDPAEIALEGSPTDLVAESLDYIRAHFLTLGQLADWTGVPPGAISSYIAYRCIPRESYTVSRVAEIESFFGHITGAREVVRYYAPSHVQWVLDTSRAARLQPLEQIAAARRDAFCRDYAEEARRIGADLLRPDELETLAQQEYESWLDGTYGLCTRTATATDIARKEISILRIKQLTNGGTKAAISQADRDALQAAMTILDDVASPFAPHERPHSSRAKWIEAIARMPGTERPSVTPV